MTLIQNLFRRQSSQPVVAPKSPVPLQPEQLKAVSGGTDTSSSPFHRW
ncbi:MAG: hypothetical protein LC125_02475 [Burkholderiales bacterium]|nr:hypothetical protein [Burkholderiales bacterium]